MYIESFVRCLDVRVYLISSTNSASGVNLGFSEVAGQVTSGWTRNLVCPLPPRFSTTNTTNTTHHHLHHQLCLHHSSARHSLRPLERREISPTDLLFSPLPRPLNTSISHGATPCESCPLLPYAALGFRSCLSRQRCLSAISSPRLPPVVEKYL